MMLRLLALLACAAALEPSIGGGRRMTVLDGTLNETYAWGPFGYQTLEGLGENNNITLSAWVTGAMAGGDEVTSAQEEGLIGLYRKYLGDEGTDLSIFVVLLKFWIVQTMGTQPKTYFWRPNGIAILRSALAANMGEDFSAETGDLACRDSPDSYVDAAVVENKRSANKLTDSNLMSLRCATYAVSRGLGYSAEASLATFRDSKESVYSAGWWYQSQLILTISLKAYSVAMSIDTVFAASDDPGASSLSSAYAAYLAGGLNLSNAFAINVTSTRVYSVQRRLDESTTVEYETTAVVQALDYDDAISRQTALSSVSAGDLQVGLSSKGVAGASASVSSAPGVEETETTSYLPVYDDDAYAPPSYAASDNVEAFSDFYHAGDSEFSTESSYAQSTAGVAAVIIVVGILSLLVLWFATGCARFKRCRCGPCYSGKFDGVNQRRCKKVAVALLFLCAGAVVTGANGPKQAFRDACENLADKIGDLASILRTVEANSAVMSLQSPIIVDNAPKTGCPNAVLQVYLEVYGAAVGDAGESVLSLVDGLAEDMDGFSDTLTEDVPGYIELGINALSAFTWLVVLFGLLSLYTTKCRCDEGFTIFLATLLILVVTIFVAVALVLAVSFSDFCQAPKSIIVEMAEDNNIDGDALKFIRFLTTCEGLNPLRNVTEVVWEQTAVVTRAIANSESACNGTEALAIEKQAVNQTARAIYAIDTSVGCADLNPIYDSIVYDVACGDLVDGLHGIIFLLAPAVILLWVGLLFIPCANYEAKLSQDQDGTSAKIVPEVGQPVKDQPTKEATEGGGVVEESGEAA